MTTEGELREALVTLDPPRRTGFDLDTATALARHRTLRRRLLTGSGVVVCFALVAAAIAFTAPGLRSDRDPDVGGSGGATSSTGPTGATTVPAGTDPHEVAAKQALVRLLDAFTPPAGATPTPARAPLLRASGGIVATNVLWANRNWIVPGTAKELYARLQPAATDTFVSSSEPSATAKEPIYEIDYLPAGVRLGDSPGIELAEGVKGNLEVQMVDIGDRTVLLRVDAQVVWTRSRTAAEDLPDDFTRLAVERSNDPTSSAPTPTTTPPRSVTHTDRATIRRVVTLLDDLEPSNAAPHSCPGLGNGENYELTLSGSETIGSPVTVVFDNVPCGTDVDVGIPGRGWFRYQSTSALRELVAQLVG